MTLQHRLREAVETFDHQTLPDHLSRAEAIAEAILNSLGDCTCVEVNRPLERLYARASK